MPDPKERTGLVLVRDVLPEISTSDTPASKWTEEQWHAHDARVRAELAQEQDVAVLANRKRAVESMIAVDGWPRRAIEVAATADEKRASIAKIKALDLSERNVIVVSGLPGCGKTVACAWWALHRRGGARFVRASSFAAASRYDREERAAWLKASALVLDDAGAEYSDAKGSLMVDLDELVDTFYGDRRPLLITTNLTRSMFKTRYGERITDRLRECGRWVPIEGGSLRTRS